MCGIILHVPKLFFKKWLVLKSTRDINLRKTTEMGFWWKTRDYNMWSFFVVLPQSWFLFLFTTLKQLISRVFFLQCTKIDHILYSMLWTLFIVPANGTNKLDDSKYSSYSSPQEILCSKWQNNQLQKKQQQKLVTFPWHIFSPATAIICLDLVGVFIVMTTECQAQIRDSETSQKWQQLGWEINSRQERWMVRAKENNNNSASRKCLTSLLPREKKAN